MWLEIAISGGAVAVLGALVAGVALLRGVPRQERYAFVLVLIALVTLGILEAPVQAAKIASELDATCEHQELGACDDCLAIQTADRFA
jgi:hypothetical protein